MKIQQTQNSKPTFGWSITQQYTRYGKSLMKATEYHRDSGLKLVVVDSYYNGKRLSVVKELYDKFYNLVARKTVDFVNGKRLDRIV